MKFQIGDKVQTNEAARKANIDFRKGEVTYIVDEELVRVKYSSCRKARRFNVRFLELVPEDD